MGLFKKKRMQISLSELFADALFLALKEANTKLVRVYMSSVGLELGEQIAQQCEAYVSLLLKYSFADMISARRIKVPKNFSTIDIDTAWNNGLRVALRNRSSNDDSFREKLGKCLAAVDNYALAFEEDRADPHSHLLPPAEKYFSASEHFVDLVVGKLTWENASEHTSIFYVAKDLFELVKVICEAAPKRFELSGV